MMRSLRPGYMCYLHGRPPGLNFGNLSCQMRRNGTLPLQAELFAGQNVCLWHLCSLYSCLRVNPIYCTWALFYVLLCLLLEVDNACIDPK